MINPEVQRALERKVVESPYPLLFATVSGAHLYGFASEDSDFDLRGAHILPLEDCISLDPPDETRTTTSKDGGLEIDLVTHDVRKFIYMLLKKNGYVLEQVLSPLVVHSTPHFEELRALAPGCVTRFHFHHYVGFFRTEWELLNKLPIPRLKPLLYCYRVLLTGIHLMRTGEVEANLERLAPEHGQTHLIPLIEAKRSGHELDALGDKVERHQSLLRALEGELRDAGESSSLPFVPTVRPQLNDLLIRVRLAALPPRT